MTTAVCPDYTPPHGKQAALLIGTKVALSSSVSAKPNGPNWRNGSLAQRISATPLLKDLVPAWSSEVAVRLQSKKVQTSIHRDPPASSYSGNEGIAGMAEIRRPRDNDSHNICLMHPRRKYIEGKRHHVYFFTFPHLMQATRSPSYATQGGKRN